MAKGRKAAPAGMGPRKKEPVSTSHMLAFPKKPTGGGTLEGRGAV